MRFTEIDIPNDVKLSEYYNKRITISSTNGKSLRFQIPRMYMPFGLSGFTPEIGPTKWNVDFSMKGWDEENNYIKKFFDFLKDIENHVKTHVKDNAIEIFGNQNVDLEKVFHSNIKEDIGREPKFRVKVDTDSTNCVKPRIFDVNEKDITENATKGLYQKYSGVALVELTSVYFLNKKFGLTWKMCQMKVYEPQRLHGFQFIEEEVEADNDTQLSGFQFKI